MKQNIRLSAVFSMIKANRGDWQVSPPESDPSGGARPIRVMEERLACRTQQRDQSASALCVLTERSIGVL